MADRDSPAQRPRILVVEDDFLIAMDIVDAVGDAGGTVVGPAHDLAQATALCAEPLDGAILDVSLGSNETSHAIAEALARRGIRTVFFTANRDKASLTERFPEAEIVDKSHPTRHAAEKAVG